MQSSDSLCGARHCQVQCSYSTAFQQSSPWWPWYIISIWPCWPWWKAGEKEKVQEKEKGWEKVKVWEKENVPEKEKVWEKEKGCPAPSCVTFRQLPPLSSQLINLQWGTQSGGPGNIYLHFWAKQQRTMNWYDDSSQGSHLPPKPYFSRGIYSILWNPFGKRSQRRWSQFEFIWVDKYMLKPLKPLKFDARDDDGDDEEAEQTEQRQTETRLCCSSQSSQSPQSQQQCTV